MPIRPESQGAVIEYSLIAIRQDVCSIPNPRSSLINCHSEAPNPRDSRLVKHPLDSQVAPSLNML